MCGIGAIYFREGVDRGILHQMLLATEKRGTDAFGITVIRPRNSEHGVRPLASRMWEFKKPTSYSKSGLDVNTMSLSVGDLVIWNCRAKPMTEPASTIDYATMQPIVYTDEGLIMSHNGVVANDDEYTLPRRTPIDSEIFLDKYIMAGSDSKRAIEQMVGGSAYLLYDDKRDMLIAIRDYQPLAKAYKRGVGYMIMSDVDEFFPILGPMDIAIWEYFYYSDLAPYQINEIDLDSGLIETKSFQPKFVSSLPAQDSNKAIVLASGGVDSSVAAVLAAKHLGKDVTLVHINSGHKSDRGEMEAVFYLADFLGCELKLINMEWLGQLGGSVLTDSNLEIPQGESRFNLKSTVCWTPARNMVMLAALVAIAEGIGASTIYNGFTLEESGSYPDNSQDFFKSFNNLSNFGTLTRPQVRMIEANLMKPEIAILGRHFGLDLTKLWSCDWTPDDLQECGTCGACTLKQLAINQADQMLAENVQDQTDYKYYIQSLLAKVTP